MKRPPDRGRKLYLSAPTGTRLCPYRGSARISLIICPYRDSARISLITCREFSATGGLVSQ